MDSKQNYYYEVTARNGDVGVLVRQYKTNDGVMVEYRVTDSDDEWRLGTIYGALRRHLTIVTVSVNSADNNK